jgi:ribokinase
MGRILVSGLLNIETTLQVEAFPLTYAPVHYPFWGVRSTVSGVGYNIARALATLGNEVQLLSLVGTDLLGELAMRWIAQHGVSTENVLAMMPETAQSVILYDGEGRRQIHVDLKDVQQRPFPPQQFAAALATCDLALLCNINWNRPFLQQARQAGKVVATDVHTISDLEDPYNGDFMAAAHILFMSDERLPCAPEEWARRVQNRYGTPIIVIGLGRAGALLAVRQEGLMERVAAVYTRPVVNSVGAGDALFSAFVHEYLRTQNPLTALETAVVFASYKIGVTGAAEGFLTAPQLATWVQQLPRTS